MKKIYILELWLESDSVKLLRQIAGFENKELLEKYKLLNPSKKYLQQYYRDSEIQIISSL